MKVLYSVVLGATLASAVFPISTDGCQCTSSCDTCTNPLDCGTGTGTKYCVVAKATCPDLSWPEDSKDDCGNVISDLYDSATSWFMGLDTSGMEDMYTKISGWADENIQAIDVDALLKAGTDKVASFAGMWDKLDTAQFEQIKNLGTEQWKKLVSEIPFDQMAMMTQATLSKIDTSQLAAIQARLQAITLEDVAGWSQEQWEKVPVENLASMGWEVLQQVPLSEIGSWTQEQWNQIPVDKLVKLTGDQLNKIDASLVSSLGDQYWDALPVYQITHFGIELLQSADVMTHLNASHVAYLTAEQWENIPVESITKFSIDKLQAINYTALGGWSKDMWDAMPIDTIADFTGKQISAIPSGTVGDWSQEMWLKFDASAAVMFSGTQLAAGADALKDMTEEQLAQFDWEQMSEDAISALPTELQDKIKSLAQDNGITSFKDLVERASDAKADMDAKYKIYMDMLANAAASVEEKQAAEAEYTSSSTEYAKLNAEMQAESNERDGVSTTDDANTAAAAASTSCMLAVLAVAILA